MNLDYPHWQTAVRFDVRILHAFVNLRNNHVSHNLKLDVFDVMTIIPSSSIALAEAHTADLPLFGKVRGSPSKVLHLCKRCSPIQVLQQNRVPSRHIGTCTKAVRLVLRKEFVQLKLSKLVNS